MSLGDLSPALVPSQRVSSLDRPSGISPPLDPLWPHPHSAVRGLRGDRSLVFILLNVFFTEAGDHFFCKPGRDDLIHAATYAIALADVVLL